MDDLIAALTIFRKYINKPYPTGCEHDVLYIHGLRADSVSEEDRAELKRLGFEPDFADEDDPDPDCDTWYSFKFGSC